MLLYFISVRQSTFYLLSFSRFSSNFVIFSAASLVVKSIEIKETKLLDGKLQYSMSQKKFDSIPELISFYKTYDFTQVPNETSRTNAYRLSKALPRPTWQEELLDMSWYQPTLSRQQAEQLLAGVCRLNFLIFFSFLKSKF